VTSGSTTSQRNDAASVALFAATILAIAYELAASHAVICHSFPTPFELADVERVKAHQLPRLLGLDVSRLASRQILPRPLGE